MARPLYSGADWSRVVDEASRSNPWRSEVARDYGRVIHSACFRRLQGKTQLFPSAELDFFRNRLTHSLEVSQIAQGIAERLNHVAAELKTTQPLDIRLCGVAGLIHDIGHPPFGHQGERALDKAMLEFGGFEGNAQNLRILGRLEKKVRDPSVTAGDSRVGLNLTFRTLASALKYDRDIPLKRAKGAKLVKGQYATEAPLAQRVKTAVLQGATCAPGKFRTIECSIMNLADDIAYSTYDLEDCLKAGFLTPLGILASGEALLDDVTKEVSKELGYSVDTVTVSKVLARVFSRITQGAVSGEDQLVTVTRAYRNSQNIADSSYTRTQLSAELVNEFINSITLTYNSDIPALSKVDLSEEAALKVEVLKPYTFVATIFSARVKLAEYKGSEIVERIFNALAGPKGELLMPDDVRLLHKGAPDETAQKRVICVFVAGMTDRYALEFYGRLFGTGEFLFKPAG